MEYSDNNSNRAKRLRCDSSISKKGFGRFDRLSNKEILDLGTDIQASISLSS
jgi:hypothetical protein